MKRPRDVDEEGAGASLNDYQDPNATLPAAKIITLDTTDLEARSTTAATPTAASTTSTIQCSLPGHTPGLPFASYSDYEEHYAKVHTNRCLECRKNFPTSHVLELHIHENHDALAKIKRERGEPTYACLVETCDQTFTGLGKRQEHLVRVHKYPHNYFFAVTKFGIDGRKSMLVDDARSQRSRPRGSRAPKPNKTEDGSAPGGDKFLDSAISKDVIMGEADTLADVPQQTVGAKRTTVTGAKAPEDRPVEATPSTVTKSAVDADIDDLAGAMSTLRFVPRAVRLGSKHRNGATHQ